MKLNDKFIAVLLLSLLLIACTATNTEEELEDPIVKNALVFKEDTISTQNKPQRIKDASAILYRVFDFDQNKWLEKPWHISDNIMEIAGYKDYSYIHPYMIIDVLRNNKQDKVKKSCWALAIGYKLQPTVAEAYIVLDFKKHLSHSSYDVDLDSTYKAEFAEFTLQDSFLLYKIGNEEAFYVEKGIPGVGTFYGGEFVEPNPSVADVFILGKPKYKLIRQE